MISIEADKVLVCFYRFKKKKIISKTEDLLFSSPLKIIKTLFLAPLFTNVDNLLFLCKARGNLSEFIDFNYTI